jgi:hypothetical protein
VSLLSLCATITVSSSVCFLSLRPSLALNGSVGLAMTWPTCEYTGALARRFFLWCLGSRTFRMRKSCQSLLNSAVMFVLGRSNQSAPAVFCLYRLAIKSFFSTIHVKKSDVGPLVSGQGVQKKGLKSLGIQSNYDDKRNQEPRDDSPRRTFSRVIVPCG